MYYQYIVHSYFSLDFTFRLICSKFPRIMLGQFCSQLEILTTVPFLCVWFLGYNSIDNNFFRACLMFDTSRVYLTKRCIDYMKNENLRDILHIVNVLMLIIFFPAAFCAYIESYDTFPVYERSDTTFFQMIYFAFISMTFIGYGSQVITEIGKVFLIFFLLICLIVLPTQAGKFMTLVAAKSPYARA